MPRRETSPMDQRMQVETEYHSGLFTMTELTEQYAITRKTGYSGSPATMPTASSASLGNPPRTHGPAGSRGRTGAQYRVVRRPIDGAQDPPLLYPKCDLNPSIELRWRSVSLSRRAASGRSRRTRHRAASRTLF